MQHLRGDIIPLAHLPFELILVSFWQTAVHSLDESTLVFTVAAAISCA